MIGCAQFDGKSYDPVRDRARLESELYRVTSCLLNSEWWTIPGLQREIELRFGAHCSATGISARLRDLRKPKHGGHVVDARLRPHCDALWEYRLRPAGELFAS